MATTKERGTMALLMQDPGFRAAWDNLRHAVAAIDPASLDDPATISDPTITGEEVA